ncbi:MAG: hypothetical protein PHG08_07115 [Bacilli bacterium]|nr:hypothetical protein [Bacilli bacterium]HHU24840.1 SpoIIIAH-like family protein [Acholeplasmataceae bacterium]
MIKKNQLALIFLTVVTMLAVWYIRTPIDKDQDNDDLVSGKITETGRLPEILAMREAIRAERSIVAMSFDAVLADENATLASKELAIQEKKALSALTEKEVLLEQKAINIGYRDAFVHATSAGVEILVISEEESAALANEIIQLAFLSFDTDSIVVDFKTAEQIKIHNNNPSD